MRKLRPKAVGKFEEARIVNIESKISILKNMKPCIYIILSGKILGISTLFLNLLELKSKSIVEHIKPSWKFFGIANTYDLIFLLYSLPRFNNK